mmetsp:Transcript_45648/g.67346  ORF Transcript_45648/g.67346 Transcript_45648/m.67346 type:complete len:243 (-) Transcript_45648:1090-1818(-)
MLCSSPHFFISGRDVPLPDPTLLVYFSHDPIVYLFLCPFRQDVYPIEVVRHRADDACCQENLLPSQEDDSSLDHSVVVLRYLGESLLESSPPKTCLCHFQVPVRHEQSHREYAFDHEDHRPKNDHRGNVEFPFPCHSSAIFHKTVHPYLLIVIYAGDLYLFCVLSRSDPLILIDDLSLSDPLTLIYNLYVPFYDLCHDLVYDDRGLDRNLYLCGYDLDRDFACVLYCVHFPENVVHLHLGLS